MSQKRRGTGAGAGAARGWSGVRSEDPAEFRVRGSGKWTGFG